MAEKKERPTQVEKRIPNEKKSQRGLEIRHGLNEGLDFTKKSSHPSGNVSPSFLNPSPFADYDIKTGNTDGD